MMFSFVETDLFSKLVDGYLTDEEYRQVQQNVRDTIPGHLLKKIRQEIENEHK